MCTSFVFRKNNKVFVGMNFDNDGKEFKISDASKGGFSILIKVRNAFFPSIGVNRNGVFVNDQMVDANEQGVYKRQNEKRWVTSKLVDTILRENLSFSEVLATLGQVEIVNNPYLSAHNLIVDTRGNVCIVEPGKRYIVSKAEETDWVILTNFPISDYGDVVPQKVAGSGSDRYLKGLSLLKNVKNKMTVKTGFSILHELQQNGPVWTTEVSLVYDAAHSELYYCLNRNFQAIKKISLHLY